MFVLSIKLANHLLSTIDAYKSNSQWVNFLQIYNKHLNYTLFYIEKVTICSEINLLG